MADGRPDAAPGPGDREAGTTITEVLVVLAATALLAVPLLSLVATVVRVESAQTQDHHGRIALDGVLEAVDRDLVNATPVASRPAGTSAADTLGVLVPDGADGIVVYWSVGRSGLTRIEAAPDTLRIQRRTTVAEAVNAPAGTTPFRYFDAAGAELDPGVVGADRLAACTTLVEVTLDWKEGDEVTATTTRRHAVRTRDPGGNGC